MSTAPVNVPILNVWLDPDEGVVHVRWAANSTVALEEAKACVEQVAELMRHRKLPLLVDMREVSNVSRDARACLAAGHTPTMVALVIGSPLNRAIGNFFIGLNKPKVPTRLFDSARAASAWVKGQQV